MRNVCEACTHFRQHYSKVGCTYQPVDRGHCVYPRRKQRENKTPACAYFKARDPAEEGEPLRYTLWVNRWWFQKIRYIAGVEGRSVNKEIEQCMKRRVREFEAEYGPIEMEWKELRPLHTEGPI